MRLQLLIPIIIALIFTLGVFDAGAFQASGKIDAEFSYQSLKLTPTSMGCELTGRIRNDTKRTRNGLTITVYGYDDKDELIGQHTFRMPTLPAKNTNFFTSRIPGGCSEGPAVDRVEFEIEY